MKDLKKRCDKIHATIRLLIAEMEAIDNELNLMCAGRSCDILEIKVIQEMVSAHFGLTPQVMLSAVRTEEYANARALAMYLARELTFYSVREIAACFGGKTHGAVNAACERIVERITEVDAFALEVTQLKRAAKCRVAEAIKEQKAKAAVFHPVPVSDSITESFAS